MSDTIQITGLTMMTHIGVHAWEQQIRQQLQFDLVLFVDIAKCADDLARTVDYAAVCEEVTAFVESQSFRLIETVAEQVADLIKQRFNTARLKLTVSKPYAIKNAKNIAVTIER